MENIKVIISEKEIAERISEMSKKINADLRGEPVVAIVMLKGAFVFAADILREINSDVTLDFVRLSSYGNETSSSGNVKVEEGFSVDISGKNVLVIEDIADTGRTLAVFMDMVKLKNPKSVRICVLLDKLARRVTDIKADYVGFEIPDVFAVGYGLDFAQKYRNLPFIGQVLDSENKVTEEEQ